MDASHLIIGIIALASGSICGIGSTFVIFQMVDRVNERLPGEQSFAPLGWYWSKYRRLFGEYKKLYPDGNLVRRFRSLIMLTFAYFLIGVWGLGFFAH